MAHVPVVPFGLRPSGLPKPEGFLGILQMPGLLTRSEVLQVLKAARDGTDVSDTIKQKAHTLAQHAHAKARFTDAGPESAHEPPDALRRSALLDLLKK